jgi:hypothetical protein
MFELLPVPLQYVAAYLTLLILVAGAVAGAVYGVRLLRDLHDNRKSAVDTT